jgi:hypothetical protein
LEGDIPQRVAPAVFATPQRREFTREQTVTFCSGGIRNSAEKGIFQGANCQVFAPAVFKICRAPRVFLYRFEHFPVVMVRVSTMLIYLLKIRQIEYGQSKNCSAGNPPPRGNPGLKCTRTDAILK